MAEDVPKTIILSLLILTVLISVLGTWTVMDRLNDVKVNYVDDSGKTSEGQVSYKVIDPNDIPETPTGKVTFTFDEPKEVE